MGMDSPSNPLEARISYLEIEFVTDGGRPSNNVQKFLDRHRIPYTIHPLDEYDVEFFGYTAPEVRIQKGDKVRILEGASEIRMYFEDVFQKRKDSMARLMSR